MELLVAGLHDSAAFKDKDGEFKDTEEWPGVHTQFGEYIKRIDWAYDEYPGLFGGDEIENILEPGGSIDIQWLPERLTHFEIGELRLEGTCDTFLLPRGIEVLGLSHNQLSGDFNVKGLPSSIVDLNIAGNNFTGPFDLKNYPPKLAECKITGNSFAGGLDIPHLPNCVRNFQANGNNFSGSVDLRVLPSELVFLDISRIKFDNNRFVVAERPNADAFIRIGRRRGIACVHPDGGPVSEFFVA